MARALISILRGGVRGYSEIKITSSGNVLMLVCIIVISVSVVSMIIFACGRRDNSKQKPMKGKKKPKKDRGSTCGGGGGCEAVVVGDLQILVYGY